MGYAEYSMIFFACCVLLAVVIRLFKIAKKEKKSINDLFNGLFFMTLLVIPVFIFTVMYYEYT